MDITTTRSYEILDRPVLPTADSAAAPPAAQRSRREFRSTMRVCIVIRWIAGGLITRIDEYFDPSDMKPLR